jgi:hypothetical protein
MVLNSAARCFTTAWFLREPVNTAPCGANGVKDVTNIRHLSDAKALPIIRERLAAFRDKASPYDAPGFTKADIAGGVYVLFQPANHWSTIVYVDSGGGNDDVVFLDSEFSFGAADPMAGVEWRRGDWEYALFGQLN